MSKLALALKHAEDLRAILATQRTPRDHALGRAAAELRLEILLEGLEEAGGLLENLRYNLDYRDRRAKLQKALFEEFTWEHHPFVGCTKPSQSAHEHCPSSSWIAYDQCHWANCGKSMNHSYHQ